MINDQSFESFALFSRRTLDFLLTSYPAYLLAGHHSDLGTKNSHETRKAEMRKLHNWTSFGSFISVTGFVCQFVGLRAMHWSASIAQLVATAIMIVVRVCLRWKLTSEPSSEKLTKGHELDWLARGHEAERFWKDRLLPASKRGNSLTRKLRDWRESLAMNSATRGIDSHGLEKTDSKRCARWALATAGSSQNCKAVFPNDESKDPTIQALDRLTAPTKTPVDPQQYRQSHESATFASIEASVPVLQPSALKTAGETQGTQSGAAPASTPANDNQLLQECHRSADKNHHVNRSQETLDIRKRLQDLSTWKGPFLEPATILAKCMEEVLNSPEIVTMPSSKKTMVWTIDAEMFGKADTSSSTTPTDGPLLERSTIQLSATRTLEGSPWVVDVDALEAALSLWIESTTILSTETKRSSTPTAKKSTADEHELPKDGLLLLGPSSPATRRDLTWWLSPEFVRQLREISFETAINFPSSCPAISTPPTWRVEMEAAVLEGKTTYEVERARVVGYTSHLVTLTKLRDTGPSADAAKPPAQESVSDWKKTGRQLPSINDHRSETTNISESSASGSSNPTNAPNPCLALPTFTTLVDLYSRHLFTGFMWAIAPLVSLRRETRAIIPTSKDGSNDVSPAIWSQIRLQNESLSNLVARLGTLGSLGRNSDEWLVLIIPPLTSQRKLVFPSSTLQRMHKAAARKIQSDDWKNAWDIYKSLSVWNSFGDSEALSMTALALQLTFRSTVSYEMAFQKLKGDLEPRMTEVLTTIMADISYSLGSYPGSLIAILEYLISEVQGGIPGWFKYHSRFEKETVRRASPSGSRSQTESEEATRRARERLETVGAALGWNPNHHTVLSYCGDHGNNDQSDSDNFGDLTSQEAFDFDTLRKTDILGRTPFHYAGECFSL